MLYRLQPVRLRLGASAPLREVAPEPNNSQYPARNAQFPTVHKSLFGWRFLAECWTFLRVLAYSCVPVLPEFLRVRWFRKTGSAGSENLLLARGLRKRSPYSPLPVGRDLRARPGSRRTISQDDGVPGKLENAEPQGAFGTRGVAFKPRRASSDIVLPTDSDRSMARVFAAASKSSSMVSVVRTLAIVPFPPCDVALPGLWGDLLMRNGPV